MVCALAPDAHDRRIDGTRAFAISDDVGDVLALAGGHDGALWFLTADAVGRLAPDGTIGAMALPEAFARAAYPASRSSLGTPARCG